MKLHYTKLVARLTAKICANDFPWRVVQSKSDKNPPNSLGAASSDRAATVQLSSLIPAQPTPLILILKLTFQKVLIDENWLHLPLLHTEHTNVMAQTWSMPSLMTHFRLHQFIVLKLFSFNQQSFRRNKYFVESQIFQKLVMIIKLELELEVEFDEICISSSCPAAQRSYDYKTIHSINQNTLGTEFQC